MRRLVISLAVGVGGMALLLAGLAWDAVLHGRDPSLAAREGVFTASNPGHLLLGAGIALTLVGLLVAGDAALTLRAGGRWGRGGLRTASAVVALVTVGATAFTGVWAARAGHGHGDGEADEHEHTDAAVPAAAAHDHAHGVVDGQPTAAERAAAERLLADTKAAVTRWASQGAAQAEGFRPITPVWNGLQHWHNQRFHTDGKVLDPSAPEELIYASTSRGPVLVAAMYLMPVVGQPGPRVGGSLTAWHAHDDLCFTLDGRVVGFARPSCPAGSTNVTTPEMLHVWVVDNPAGPFAEEMAPAALVALAERG